MENAKSLPTLLKGFTLKDCHSESDLSEKFKEIAQSVLFGGYFLINGTRKVYACDIEFYFHHEGDQFNNQPIPDYMKDEIMYHRTGSGAKEYYGVGTLNAHPSGIDVTFENGKENYRASFLARGFKIDSIDGKEDDRSTYFYEALMTNVLPKDGTGIKLYIEWYSEDYDKERIQSNDIEVTYRQNVPLYEGNNKVDFDEKKHEQKTKSGKYAQDMRKWRFKRRS